MRVRKTQKGCDRCKGLEVQARYRALFDRWVCERCYPLAIQELKRVSEDAIDGLTGEWDDQNSGYHHG